MANEYLTLLDVAKFNADDGIVGLIEKNLDTAPEVARFHSGAPIAGTQYTTLFRESFPEPEFRAPNSDGTETKKSQYSNRTVQCFYLDGQLEMDVATAEADEKGVGHALAMEADGMMRGSLHKIGRQIWYGTLTGTASKAGDALGFPGASQMVDSTMVVDATGTTADTGSSVYAVKFGPDWVSIVPGAGNVFSLSEWTKQRVTSNSKHKMAWLSSLSGWIGVQWINPHGLGKIKNLTAESGKGLTDNLISDLLHLYPSGITPDALFMTRRSRKQLQQSRTSVATHNAGPRQRLDMTVLAEIPTESHGIPIIVTDSLGNDESIA